MPRRRLPVLALLLVLALTGAGTLVAASPASARPVTVKAPRVGNARPIGTETITLTGSLGRSVKRVAKLQRRAGGRWRFVQRRVVGPKGRYTFRVPMPGPAATFRVVSPPQHKRGRKWPQRISRPRTVYRAVETAYTAVAKSVKVGTPTPVSLAFSPARPGRGGELQVDEGAGWHTVAGVTQDGAGRATVTYTPQTTGMVQLRAVAAPYHGAGQVTGAPVRLAVLRTEPVEVAAHRGASLNNPENTIPAIKNAVRLGADWIELDVRRIADDVATHTDGTTTSTPHFVLMHDKTFKRTTNVEQVFPTRQNAGTLSFTWAEVQRLDAGSWKAARFAHARVPDLKMALDAITSAEAQYGRQVRVILEFKGDQAAQMAAMYDQVKALRPDWISAASHDDKLVFMSFDYATVFDQVRTGDRAADGAEFAGVMDAGSDPVYDWLNQMHVNSSLASPAVAEQVHGAGPRMAVWTVDSADSILAAATAGTDIVTTDDVATARSVLLR